MKALKPMYNKENLAELMKTDSLAPEAIMAFLARDEAAVAAPARKHASSCSLSCSVRDWSR